ncbi:MAG: hypothetical protein IJU16_02335, partial [Clostridia bacterium]|nr:hypothetical protein [Clostridia bacterium]
LHTAYKGIYNNAVYTYDDNGIRTAREVTANGVTTNYTYQVVDGTLRKMTAGSDTLEFFYGQNGVASVVYNNAEYFYIRNAQGDILGLIDDTGSDRCALSRVKAKDYILHSK